MLEVNAMGEVQRNLGDRPSESGQDLTLTLDLDLQQRCRAQRWRTNLEGLLWPLEAKDGRCTGAWQVSLALIQTFFSKLITTQKEYDALFSNPKKPLLSRAMNPYDPGSTWKPVTAMAGMESGKFPPDTKLAHQGLHHLWRPLLPRSQRCGFWPYRVCRCPAFLQQHLFSIKWESVRGPRR